MDRVRVVLNLFTSTGDIEYTLGYINLNNINTVQELFDVVYNLPNLSEFYNGYVYLLDFNTTILIKSFSTIDELNELKQAILDDRDNYIYVRTIFDFLDSNPRYRNRPFLKNWLNSDNTIRDPKLYSDVFYGIGL